MQLLDNLEPFMKIKYFATFSLLSLLLTFVGYATEPTPVSHPKVMIILGPPGAGKGTVAVKLADTIGLPHISTGDLFRENIQKNTELGKKAKAYMEKGLLVPDELVLDMLLSRVEKPDCSKGYILDGFPRTLPQAEALSKHIASKSKIIAINLEVSNNLIVDRIVQRRVCASCGAPYHLKNHPPLKEDVCDRCSGKLIQRGDDTAEVITKRLKVYQEQTAPLVAYYKKLGYLVSINGDRPQNEVFEEVLSKVK